MWLNFDTLVPNKLPVIQSFMELLETPLQIENVSKAAYGFPKNDAGKYRAIYCKLMFTALENKEIVSPKTYLGFNLFKELRYSVIFTFTQEFLKVVPPLDKFSTYFNWIYVSSSPENYSGYDYLQTCYCFKYTATPFQHTTSLLWSRSGSLTIKKFLLATEITTLLI